MRLRVELFQYEDIIFGKVLFIDPSIKTDTKLAEQDGFVIYSYNGGSELRSNYLYASTRSDDTKAIKTFLYRCAGREGATKMVSQIKCCLEQINKSTEGLSASLTKVV